MNVDIVSRSLKKSNNFNMTMPYELHRNSIITGTLYCFCLACDSFLQNREEAVCHIETSSHYENLRAVPYLEKFKDQFIRKFNTGYFCEFCNKLMQTTMHVNLHLCEEHHQQNRGSMLLKSLGPDVVAFNNLLIEERVWHGLIDNTCCICVTEFEDEFLHKQNVAHALSLIQKPVKFGENDIIYRPIDDSSFHCVTCNKLLCLGTMNKHFNDADHLDLYARCKMILNNNSHGKDSGEKVVDAMIKCDDDNSDTNKINSYFKQTNDNNNNKDGTETALSEKSFIDIHSNQFNREDSLNAATLTETDGSKYIKTSEIDAVLDVKDQYKGHNENSVDNDTLIQDADVLQQISNLNTACENVNISESGSSHLDINNADDIGIIATDNNITYNNSNNAFCRSCKVKLQFNLKSINEHVKGARHKKKLMATQTRQSMVVFVHSLLRVQRKSEMEINSGYLINNKYYIGLLSYLLLAKNTCGGFRCLLCDITLPPYPEVPVEHIDKCSLPKGKHIQIIISEKDEFIREIQLDTFHCGFCHIVVRGWNEMQRHLRSPEHDRQKSESYHQFKIINFKLLQRYVTLVEL